MIEVSPQIGSGITLAAFIAAVSASIYRIRSLHEIRLINTAPEAERARLVEAKLVYFRIDTGNLTKEQKHTLAVRQIDVQARRSLHAAILVAIIAFLAAGVTAYAIGHDGKEKEKQVKEKEIQLEKIDKARGELEKKLEDLARESARLLRGVEGISARADEMSRANPEVIRLRDHLERLLAQFDSHYKAELLSEGDALRIRIAKAAKTKAANRPKEALSILTQGDETAEANATEIQIAKLCDVLRIRGDAFFMLGEWGQALERYEQILKYRPGGSFVSTEAGDCLGHLGRWAEAAQRYGEFVKILDHHEHLHGIAAEYLGHLLVKRAECYSKAGDHVGARGDFERAIEIYDRLAKDYERSGDASLETNMSAFLAFCLIARGNCKVALKQELEDEGDYLRGIEIFERLRRESIKLPMTDGRWIAIRECLAYGHVCLGKLRNILSYYNQFMSHRFAETEFAEAAHTYDLLVLTKGGTELELASAQCNTFLALARVDHAAFLERVELETRSTDDPAVSKSRKAGIAEKYREALTASNEAIELYSKICKNNDGMETSDKLAGSLAIRSLIYARTGQKDRSLADLEHALRIAKDPDLIRQLTSKFDSERQSRSKGFPSAISTGRPGPLARKSVPEGILFHGNSIVGKSSAVVRAQDQSQPL